MGFEKCFCISNALSQLYSSGSVTFSNGIITYLQRMMVYFTREGMIGTNSYDKNDDKCESFFFIYFHILINYLKFDTFYRISVARQHYSVLRL